MKLYIIILSLFVSLLTILPGCGRIVDWTKGNFYQGEYIRKDSAIDKAREYIKYKRVYDQFTIVGEFDALWLCDPVRSIYTDLHFSRTGRPQEQKSLFLRRQFEEKNHFISFYVLSLSDFILGDRDSKWSISLQVGDRIFEPVKVKMVDLSCEYVEIFGKRLSKFKDPYIVLFNALDLDDKFIINDKTEKILLLFKSIDKEFELVWELKSCCSQANNINCVNPVISEKR
jgi:hypothetical protein